MGSRQNGTVMSMALSGCTYCGTFTVVRDSAQRTSRVDATTGVPAATAERFGRWRRVCERSRHGADGERVHDLRRGPLDSLGASQRHRIAAIAATADTVTP
jgi:hypothetical protein